MSAVVPNVDPSPLDQLLEALHVVV
jgi:hypothetical protein